MPDLSGERQWIGLMGSISSYNDCYQLHAARKVTNISLQAVFLHNSHAGAKVGMFRTEVAVAWQRHPIVVESRPPLSSSSEKVRLLLKLSRLSVPNSVPIGAQCLEPVLW